MEYSILCVEDDLDIQFLLKLSLRNIPGCEIRMASNGVEALKMIQDFKPDLVLVDWMMPGMNGFELITKIKEESSLKDIKSLLITAKKNVNNPFEDNCYLFDDIIIKPFDYQDIQLSVKKLLGFT